MDLDKTFPMSTADKWQNKSLYARQ
jgi:hypothetical protein